MTINCTQFDDGACLAGHHRGRPPALACQLCQHRTAIFARARALIYAAGDRTVTICVERLPEEWSGEWLDRLRAAVIRRTETRVTLPAAFYAEALKHRRSRRAVAR